MRLEAQAKSASADLNHTIERLKWLAKRAVTKDSEVAKVVSLWDETWEKLSGYRELAGVADYAISPVVSQRPELPAERVVVLQFETADKLGVCRLEMPINIDHARRLLDHAQRLHQDCKAFLTVAARRRGVIGPAEKLTAAAIRELVVSVRAPGLPAGTTGQLAGKAPIGNDFLPIVPDVPDVGHPATVAEFAEWCWERIGWLKKFRTDSDVRARIDRYGLRMFVQTLHVCSTFQHGHGASDIGEFPTLAALIQEREKDGSAFFDFPGNAFDLFAAHALDESAPGFMAMLDDGERMLTAAMQWANQQAAETTERTANEDDIKQYVTLDRLAAIVGRSKRTLEKLRTRKANPLPDPDIDGGGGKPNEWVWSMIRPWLEAEYKRVLPEHFPADRIKDARADRS